MTSLLILGLLKLNGTMSGYDIQSAMEATQTDMWAYVQPASIYYALKKLEKSGFVSFDELQQVGNRSKAIYKITEKGLDEYVNLIDKCMEINSIALPTKLYTALTFIHDLPLDKLEFAINKQQIEINNMYSNFKEIEILKKKLNAYPKNVELIFSNIYKQFEIQLETLEQIRNEYLKHS